MIKSFIVEGIHKEQLNNIFRNPVIEIAFDSNFWIAGGFAREVCHAHFDINSNNKKTNRIINYLSEYYSSGDIDLFCNSKNEYDLAYKKISGHMKNLSHYDNVFEHPKLNCYTSDFALNFDYFDDNISEIKDIKVQLVNKFFFKNIEECFNSFDVLNCKYGILKEKNDYIVYYEEEALECDAKKILKLSSSDSPFTIARIIKYLKYRNLENISEDKKTQSIFLECLYKAVENNWPSHYNIKEEIFKVNVKRLHKTVRLPDNLLTMFIGFAKEEVLDKKIQQPNSSGYGVYFSNKYRNVDWATNELVNTCK